MRQVSATEARKNFFTLLDWAAGGETVIIKRKGDSLRLIREKPRKKKASFRYGRYFHTSTDKADSWLWDWDPQGGLTFKSS